MSSVHGKFIKTVKIHCEAGQTKVASYLFLQKKMIFTKKIRDLWWFYVGVS